MFLWAVIWLNNKKRHVLDNAVCCRNDPPLLSVESVLPQWICLVCDIVFFHLRGTTKLLPGNGYSFCVSVSHHLQLTMEIIDGYVGRILKHVFMIDGLWIAVKIFIRPVNRAECFRVWDLCRWCWVSEGTQVHSQSLLHRTGHEAPQNNALVVNGKTTENKRRRNMFEWF